MPDESARNPRIPPRTFDPERARKLLHDAGWRDTDHDGILDRNNVPFTFDLIVMDGSTSSVAQVVQGGLKAIGVEMRITIMDPATAIRHILDGNYDAAYLAAELDPIPDLFNALHSSQLPPHGQNLARYRSQKADRLIQTARTATTQKARDDAHHELHTLLTHDQPYTWMNQASHKWVLNDRLINVQESRTAGLFGWHPGELGWRLRSP